MTIHPQPQTFTTALTPLEQKVLAEFERSPLLDGTALVKTLGGEALSAKEFRHWRRTGEAALVRLQQMGLLTRDARGWWYRLPQ